MSSLPAESPTEETAMDAAKMAEMKEELANIEEEIETLTTVLVRKKSMANELKKKLGIPVPEDHMLGLKNVKESIVVVEEKLGSIGRAVIDAPIYQKTESMVKSTAEKTVSILGGIGSNISNKLGQIKNSESFRSFEEKVGNAYENVKGRVTPSRSMSQQSFIDAVHEDRQENVLWRESSGEKTGSVASTPTIPEEKAVDF